LSGSTIAFSAKSPTPVSAVRQRTIKGAAGYPDRCGHVNYHVGCPCVCAVARVEYGRRPDTGLKRTVAVGVDLEGAEFRLRVLVGPTRARCASGCSAEPDGHRCHDRPVAGPPEARRSRSQHSHRWPLSVIQVELDTTKMSAGSETTWTPLAPLLPRRLARRTASAGRQHPSEIACPATPDSMPRSRARNSRSRR
jgi:hypothetical protein